MSFQRRAASFGLARRPEARTLGANSPDSSEDYMASGAYAPTITPNGGTTASAPTDWVWTRVGNGGVAAAGDVVHVSGKLSASRGAVGQGIITFTLPSVSADLLTASAVVDAYVLADGSMLGAVFGLDDADTGSITITDLDTSTLVQIEMAFQVA